MPDPSLRTRILLLTAVPVIIAALALGSYVTISRIADLQSSSQQLHRLTGENYAARATALIGSDQKAFQQLMLQLLEERDVRAATLSREDTVIAHAGPRMRPSEEPDAQAATAAHTGMATTDSGWRWSHALPDGSQLEVEFSSDRQHIDILQTLLTVMATTLVIVLLALVPALHFSRRLSSPVADFTRAVQRIRDGELNTRIHSQASGELADLKRAINNMAEALEEAQNELQQNVDQATQDLRETLETIEIQNIELDMARKEALKASRVKSEFLANMSHEIRTPLNGIMGFTRLLLRSDPTARQRDHLQTIHKSSEALLSIINDILDFSKIEAGKLNLEREPADLHDIIEDVQTMLAPLAHDKDLEQVAIIYSDVPIKLIADPLRIRQVLTNLVSNAIKFTEQGSVVVRAMLEERRNHLATIRISVTDTGAGISAEKQKELFNAFTQIDQSSARRVGGTGLGLAICKRLAEEMGGEIGVESTPGEGSTFWFSLRVEIDEHSPVTDSFRAFREQKALLVEHNEYARLGLYHMLRSWQIEVETVDSLENLSQEDSRALTDFDFILIGLPPGSEGDPRQQKIIETLCRETDTALVILCNQSERLMAMAEDKHPGNCRVLAKPATRLRLYDCLLQLKGDSSPPLNQSNHQTVASHPGVRVMVVDDHPGNLHLATVFLEELGARVTSCGSGEEALRAFSDGHFDLIFMDIQMPGMDGMEVTRQMREREHGPSRTPIVALTAHALASERRELLASGMDDYISKPVTEQHLRHVLDQWVNHLPVQTQAESDSSTAATRNIVFDPELALRRAGGKQDLAEDMHRMLMESLQTDQQAIRDSAARDDHVMLLEHVHRLHGATRYCGAVRLEQATRKLEEALKTATDSAQRHQALEGLFSEIRALEDQAPDSIIANAST